MVEVMLGLLQQSLSAGEQVAFAALFSEVGRLLQTHANGGTDTIG
jgi:hypothetical protein